MHEYIAKIETEPAQESPVRFETLTEENRNELLEGADSKSTKNSTKVGVKIFRGKYISSIIAKNKPFHSIRPT